MRRITAAAAAALLGMSATTAQALEPVFLGSDTFNDMMVFLLGPGGYNFDPAVITYGPVGSGAGEDAIEQRVQEWAPMSRFLTNVAGNVNGCGDAEADPEYSGCWQVAIDTLLVLASASQAPIADLDCEAMVRNQNMPVTDANGDGSIVCPGCVAGGPTGLQYPFTDWRSVLRIIYAGQEQVANDTTSALDSAARCNSDVRRTLVNSWDNLFKNQAGDADDACPTGVCPNGLKHAFRRDDVSGTTAVFLSMLQLPPIVAAVSSNPIPPVAANPFCNGTEVDDADPIRRSCGALVAATDGFQQAGSSEDTICGFGKDARVRNAQGHITAVSSGQEESLGLVVPVLVAGIPDAYTTSPGTGNVNCGAAGEPIAGGGAAFQRVAWPLADQLRFGARCPNGAASASGCFWPKRAGTGGTPTVGFGCIAATNNRPPDTVGGTGAASGFDARIYNMWTRNQDGTVKTYNRTIGGVLTAKRAYAAMYKYRQHFCRFPDETSSQGCFVNQDKCTIGFGGRSATTGFADVRGLAFENPVGTISNPEEAELATYPLTRPLYFCQTEAFGTAPLQSAGFMAAQEEIYNDLVDDNHATIDLGVAAGDFFPVASYTKTCCTGTWDGPGTDTCSP